MNDENPNEITIKVKQRNGRFDFTYDPSAFHACAAEYITWSSRHGPFAIEFKKDTPGNHMSLHGDYVGGGLWRTAQLVIRPDARGHYHYAVALSLSGEEFGQELDRRVVMDAACPEIIVN